MKKLLNAYYKIDDCVEIAIKYLCALLLGIMPAAIEMVKIYGPRYSTSTHLPLWVLYVSYPVGSIAMVLGYLRITPGKVKALWTNTVEKTEFEKINEGEIE